MTRQGDDAVMKRDVEASTNMRAPIERAHDLIIADPGCVVVERCSADERRERRFHDRRMDPVALREVGSDNYIG